MADTATLRRRSVQGDEPKENLSTHYLWYGQPGDGILSHYGSHVVDKELREYYRNVFAAVAQDAVAAVVRKVKQTPAEITGGGRLKSYYQRLLFFDSEFSKGWDWLLSKVLLDFLTCNYGAYVEIIGAGNPRSQLRGRALGIAHLDSLRCLPTGNDEYPVVYYAYRPNKKPAIHFLHKSRVYRMVDMVDGDERFFEVGQCALYRAVSIITQQVNLSAYINGQLSDMPGAGILYNEGIDANQWKDAYAEYQARRNSGYKGAMVLNDPQGRIKGSLVNFATAPDGFSYTEYMEIAVNAFAAAFGIDRQDIWPLTGKMAGTATQSEVLNQKASGQMYGDILKLLERFINDRILPDRGSMEFSFEWRDDEADKMHVERTASVVNIASTLVSQMGWSTDMANQYLMNNAKDLRDVLTTAPGELASVTDDDPADGGEAVALPEEDVPATDDAPEETTAAKALQATRLDFEDAFADALKAAREGDMNRRRFGTVVRGLLQRYGRMAYEDGLRDGGVADATLDDDDRARLALLLADQSRYVSNFGAVLFQQGISSGVADMKPAMWFNKSIQPFYDAGLFSADRNGNYEWVYGDTEHCDTCLRLNGQVHRLRDWHGRELMPKSSRLDCKGFNCQCSLIRTNERARGRF